MNVTSADMAALMPLWIVGGGALVLLIVEALFREPSRRYAPWLAGFFSAAALWFTLTQLLGYGGVEESHFSGALVLDAFALGTQAVCLLSAVLAAAFSDRFLRRMRAVTGEYYALVLFSASGMWLLAAATEFITLFVALELVSIPAYVLAGYLRVRERSTEAAFKYFLMGSFASALLLYGVAILYGLAGDTHFGAVRETVMAGGQPVWAAFAAVLLLAALGFKVAVAPFHAWAPDVYDGAPSPVSGFLATGVKAAGFAALARVLTEITGLSVPLGGVLAVVAVLTMTVGNLGALAQGSVKRMLAYSSVAQAGYVAVGLALAGKASATDVQYAVGFYLLAYTLMTAGAFAVTGLLSGPEDEHTDEGDLAGAGWRRPWAGVAMAVFMFSLTGIPPTAGFFGKYFLFKLAVDNGMTWLALVGVLNAFVSAYYYLRVVVILFMKPRDEKAAVPAEGGLSFGLALAACALGTVLIGFAGFLI